MTASISRATVIAGASAPEWRTAREPVDYPTAVAAMEARVAAIRNRSGRELVWLLEHPALYTAGTSAKPEDLLNADGLPIYQTGRGGQYTWHGPGQRVAFVVLDLTQRGADVRRHVRNLEDWIIRALARFNVTGERRAGRVGIWIDRGKHDGRAGQEDKIAAIGVRVRRWVSFHGVSLNVEPDLEHFSGIVACGIEGHGVTSLADLGLPVTMPDVDAALRATWEEVFGDGDTRSTIAAS